MPTFPTRLAILIGYIPVFYSLFKRDKNESESGLRPVTNQGKQGASSACNTNLTKTLIVTGVGHADTHETVPGTVGTLTEVHRLLAYGPGKGARALAVVS